MKKIHIGLLPRIVIAIAAGIAFGNVLPMMLIRAFVTFNGIFIRSFLDCNPVSFS